MSQAYLLQARDLSLQTLGVGDGTDAAMWQRFDKFNEKYEPFGVKSLREIFLKHDNVVDGRFLADITREVIGGDVSANNHVYLEPRLSIYGRCETEWDVLASWVVRYNLTSKRVKWMVQIPRIFRKIAESLAGKSAAASSSFSFQSLLNNIFKPLFEVTQNPQSHPDLHKVLYGASPCFHVQASLSFISSFCCICLDLIAWTTKAAARQSWTPHPLYRAK